MVKERNTYQKNLIKETVLNMCTHPSADSIFECVKESCPNISRATVYRVLNQLADKGEIYRVKVIDGPDRYDKTLCKHYHVKCSDCGEVADAEITVFEDMEDRASNSSGYTITGHDIVFSGICPKCMANNK